MKTLFKILLAAAALTVSCSEDKESNDPKRSGGEWDYANESVYFEVVDKTTGANLLDPAVDGNILGQPIRVFYNGETYDRITVDDLRYHPNRGLAAASPGSRTMMLLPLALRWGFNEITGRYLLKFGEWDLWNFAGVRFTIDWGDGTRNEIEVGARGKRPDGISYGFYAIVDGREMPDIDVRIER